VGSIARKVNRGGRKAFDSFLSYDKAFISGSELPHSVQGVKHGMWSIQRSDNASFSLSIAVSTIIRRVSGDFHIVSDIAG